MSCYLPKANGPSCYTTSPYKSQNIYVTNVDNLFCSFWTSSLTNDYINESTIKSHDYTNENYSNLFCSVIDMFIYFLPAFIKLVFHTKFDNTISILLLHKHGYFYKNPNFLKSNVKIITTDWKSVSRFRCLSVNGISY